MSEIEKQAMLLIDLRYRILGDTGTKEGHPSNSFGLWTIESNNKFIENILEDLNERGL